MWVTHNKDDKLNLKFQKDFVKEGQRAQDGHTKKLIAFQKVFHSSRRIAGSYIMINGLKTSIFFLNRNGYKFSSNDCLSS